MVLNISYSSQYKKVIVLAKGIYFLQKKEPYGGMTKWWQATIHSAIIIYSKNGSRYPFPLPHTEIPSNLVSNSSQLSIFDLVLFPF